MYYLYQHIREDKKEIFYIGIGTKNLKTKKYSRMYYRAFEKIKSRNSYWKNIIALTPYRIEIIYETNNFDEILNKEIEFIAKYKDTLCNLTDGDLGLKSYSHTKQSKQRISKTLTGKNKSANHIKNMNKRKYKPVIAIKDTQYYYFKSREEACIELNLPLSYRANITRSIKSGYKVKGYLFKEIIESKDKEL